VPTGRPCGVKRWAGSESGSPDPIIRRGPGLHERGLGASLNPPLTLSMRLPHTAYPCQAGTGGKRDHAAGPLPVAPPLDVLAVFPADADHRPDGVSRSAVCGPGVGGTPSRSTTRVSAMPSRSDVVARGYAIAVALALTAACGSGTPSAASAASTYHHAIASHHPLAESAPFGPDCGMVPATAWAASVA
jgi:hypothetical protein